MGLERIGTAVLVAAFVPMGIVESQTEQPPIVQPGAPGQPSKLISADEASVIPGDQFTEADVSFMQGMISHHAQALEMTELLATRSEREVMHTLAKRIALSQEDEIKMMQEWLRSHGREVPAVDAHHAHDAVLMPGMLTREEMSRLEQARGIEFDRLFLELMIEHHRGALIMVEDLLAKPGGGQASDIFAFTSDITADQSMEIDRMGTMLTELSVDPRAHLDPGFRDAGQAILNLELVATLQKPAGFFDPDAPAGRPIPPERDSKDSSKEPEKTEKAEETAEKDPTGEGQKEEETKEEPPPQGPVVLSFANTDLAFAKDTLFEGNYHGFNTYNVEDPATPALLGSVVCPGGQGDVSVLGNLLFMSVEQTRGRLDCGLEGVLDPVSNARFRGIRIFDISDVRMPRQVAAVQTCRGSHTHTLVTDPDDQGNLYLYGSGTSSVRSGEELTECSDKAPDADSNTALFSIDVIRVPVAHPEEARIVARPRIFADPDSGAIAGLWKGGDHGPGTQKTSETNQCHDITVFPEIGLAAGACSGNGILLDISDPVNPVRLDQVVDPSFAYWHSATFNNDGTKVIFTDEWGGGARPRCRASDPKEWGADAVYDIVDRKLVFRSHYKMPAPQTEQENCVAHNGSLVPVPGRDIMVQAWYQGGISVFDFTDSANPVEIAYFDRGPIDGKQLMMGGYWSAYWFDGYIYGTEIARGLDVLKLVPSEHLSQSEIDAADLISPDVVNVQQQRRIEWPASPVVARARLDQLTRTHAIPDERASALTAALARAEEGGGAADELEALATELERESAETSESDQARITALASAVKKVAESLR
ncbi:MAG TPA: DUF305 domain-containing protein [Vicinamibacteria bacterium]|nr:DUF305 domain-containing protein [Vicinamibacteria bacterium]